MKKEEVYINLQGKSEEYCGKVYDILNSNGEKTHVSKIEMHIYSNGNEKYHFSDGYWTDGDVNKAANKQEVTIEELKEILKMTRNQELREEAKKRGYTHDNFKCLINKKSNGTKNIENWHYEEWADTLYSNSLGNGGQVVYKDGAWAEILQPMETLQEKEQRLLKELEEVRKQNEESKIKVGDVCKFWNDNKNSFVIGVVQHVCENAKLKYETIFDCQFPNAEKITNPELIKLLENEIK